MAIWSRRPCLSGNRNFEGRVNPLVKANYLASPPLVVAYALAGTTDIDLTKEPLGKGSDGKDVFLERHLAHREQVAKTVAAFVMPAMFRSRYSSVVGQQSESGTDIKTSEGDLYDWDPREHVHSGAAVFDRPAAEAGADPADPAARCWRCWAIP